MREAIARQFAAFYGLLISAGAFVLFGHATVSPERWLSLPADIVHVVFAAMWAGGLVGLVVVLRGRFRLARPTNPGKRRPPTGRGHPEADWSATATARSRPSEKPPRHSWNAPPKPRPTNGDQVGPGRDDERVDNSYCCTPPSGIVSRFSTMAGVSFAFIIVAGVLLAIAEVGSVANLFGTGYGQLLLVKVGVRRPPPVRCRLQPAPAHPLGALRIIGGEPGNRGVDRGWRRLVGDRQMGGDRDGRRARRDLDSRQQHAEQRGDRTTARAPPPHPALQRGSRSAEDHPENQALVNNWTVQFTGPAGANLPTWRRASRSTSSFHRRTSGRSKRTCTGSGSGSSRWPTAQSTGCRNVAGRPPDTRSQPSASRTSASRTPCGGGRHESPTAKGAAPEQGECVDTEEVHLWNGRGVHDGAPLVVREQPVPT